MKMKLLCMALIISFSVPILAKTALKLPVDLPELSPSSVSNLGTNENNIGLKIGDSVQPFTIRSHLGEMISLKQLQAHGNLMFVFYRGGWCPYCNVQVRQLSVAWPEFKSRAITPVLISADQPDAAMIMQRGYEIPFPVLSDPELIAHKVFNVVFKLPDDLVSVYKDYGIVLEDWTGKNHHQFAVASVFIVDQQGKVKWAHSSKDYKTRPSIEQLLKVIDQLH